MLRSATESPAAEQASVHRELGLAVALGDLDRGGVEPGLLDDPAVLVSGEAGHGGVTNALQHRTQMGVERFFVHEVGKTKRRDGKASHKPATTVFFTPDDGERTVDDRVTPFRVGVGAGEDALGAGATASGRKIPRVGVGAITRGDVHGALAVEEIVVADVSAVGNHLVDAAGALRLHRHVLVHGFGHGRVLERLDPGEDLFGQGDLQSAKGITLVSEEVVGGAIMLALDGNASRADVDRRHMGMWVGWLR